MLKKSKVAENFNTCRKSPQKLPKVTEQLVAKPKQEGMPYVFHSDAKTKVNSVFQGEAKNEIRKPKFKSLFQSDWRKGKQKLKFKSVFQSVVKTYKNQIRFSMSRVNEKRKMEMEIEIRFTRPKKNEK